MTGWLDHESFARVYRMSRRTFRRIFSLVSEDLVIDRSMDGVAHDGAIPVQIRVGIRLRAPARGSPLDLMQLFHIPLRTIDYIVHDVCSVIGTRLHMPAAPTR